MYNDDCFQSFEMPPLSDEDRAKLQSCIEEIRNVIGDAPVSERQLVETVLKHCFDFAKSLDAVLNDMSQKLEPHVKKDEKKEPIAKGENIFIVSSDWLTTSTTKRFFFLSNFSFSCWDRLS